MRRLVEVYSRFEENAMPPISDPGQRKRAEKIERLRTYFNEYSPRTYEWTTSDEELDFANMSDEDVARYLEHSTKTQC